MKKYLLFSVLIIMLVFSGAAYAVEPPDAAKAAEELAALGLLQGDGQGGFDLDAPCNRLHGAVLFTRLLGQEQVALNNPRPHPFADIGNASWVAPYLGYLYNNGLAYGQARDHYGSGQMLPAHFATFCLRALGYTEGSVNSDFMWNDALNFMVEKAVISGTLRNRLRHTPNFTRGDAVLLAYATLSAEMKSGGQTLLQHLIESGAVSAQQVASLSMTATDFHIAYPTGLLADGVLDSLAAQNGLSIGRLAYEPTPQGEEDLYLALREPDSGFDICIVPGYLVERLRQDGLLRKFLVRDFGGREAFVSAVRDNPYWFNEADAYYYALPLACEAACLYYDNTRVQNPDWGWLLRESYSGGVYLPADTSLLMPLALHYYKLPYNTAEDKKLLPAISLLSGQNSAVPAYLDEHMLDIPEREGAVFGVIPSRLLPELERRQQDNSAYTNWRAIVPASGAPLNLYYAVMPQSGNKQAAPAVLRGLLEPQNAAANAQFGGYLPVVNGAGTYLSGAIATAYPGGRWENCRLLDLDISSRGFFEQGVRNALLLEAQDATQPELAKLEFSFERQGRVYQAYRVDLDARTAGGFWAGAEETEVEFNAAQPLPERLIKEFKKEANRIGLALWKEYYDGPADGPSWSMTLTFADGTTKSSGGFGLPLLWYDLTGAMLKLCAEDALPNTLR